MSEYSPVPLVELANLIGEFVKAGAVSNVCAFAVDKLLDVDHFMADGTKQALKSMMIALTDFENKDAIWSSINTPEKFPGANQVNSYIIRARKFPPLERWRRPEQFVALLNNHMVDFN